MRARAALVLSVSAFLSGPRALAEDPVTKAPPSARTNRLAGERSPYLLQHRFDPVDWRPWGPEALAEAKRRGVPIFLSIGYAACHWCHVMAHESFQDPATATLLNEAFVCVKVDREERPDVDDVYMAAVQVTTGRGGWPMTCLLTPDGRPFLARTYLPRDVLQRVARQVRELWATDRPRLEAVADEVAAAVRATTTSADLPPFHGTDADLVALALERLRGEFDAERGGFDRVPKFPPHAALLFLLDRQGANGGEAGLAMARTTLDAMASGGVRDQVGGGFHRYATDERWLVPHFEKMLYDNALLARAYVEAYAIGAEPRYAKVARETLEWIVREMSVAGGGYASSLDADTDGEEGLTYTWTLDELVAALGERDAALAARAFGATKAGNYAEEASGRRSGRNILHLPVPLPALAEREGRSPADLETALDGFRTRLLAVRAKRPQPPRDAKVVTAWNGLLVGAFARAGTVLRDPAWTARAADLARYVLRASRDGERLLRFPKDSGPPVLGFLDDHAHLADALLDLAEATGDSSWRGEAERLADAILDGFSDPSGGFHSASTGHEALLARPKDAFDSPIPSANATAARVLLRLAARGEGDRRREAADRAIAAYRPLLARAPTGTTAFVRVVADRAALASTGAVAEPGDASARRGPAAVDLFLERAEARPGTRVRFVVRVALERGWHVNPPPPARGDLVPTTLALAPRSPVTMADLAWPTPTKAGPVPGPSPIDVYEGTFEIAGALEVPAGAPSGPRKIGVVLGFQPCDATSCAAPEEVRLDVPLRFSDADGPPRHPTRFR